MEKQKIKLEVEDLEERIAPSLTTSLLGLPQADGLSPDPAASDPGLETTGDHDAADEAPAIDA